MTKIGAHVCGCKVALLNGRNMGYFFMRWHEVVFVKWPGPLHAPPRTIATMVLKMESGREKKRMNEHKDLKRHCKDK